MKQQQKKETIETKTKKRVCLSNNNKKYKPKSQTNLHLQIEMDFITPTTEGTNWKRQKFKYKHTHIERYSCLTQELNRSKSVKRRDLMHFPFYIFTANTYKLCSSKTNKRICEEMKPNKSYENQHRRTKNERDARKMTVNFNIPTDVFKLFEE